MDVFTSPPLLHLSYEDSIMAKKTPGTRVRSAITGRFVRKGTAGRHPKTTVTETVKPRKPCKK